MPTAADTAGAAVVAIAAFRKGGPEQTGCGVGGFAYASVVSNSAVPPENNLSPVSTVSTVSLVWGQTDQNQSDGPATVA